MREEVVKLSRLLANQIYRQQLAHAYLFSGVDFDEKMYVVHQLIQSLACHHLSSEGESCGQCERCARVQSNQMSDVMYVEPDGQSVKVDQIRALKEWLSSSPIELNFKVGVIVGADTMNPSAANALLTFLEEPVDNVYLILLAKAADNVLPTIRSRVQHYYMTTPTQARLYDVLVEEGMDKPLARTFSFLNKETVARLRTSHDEEALSQWLKQANYFYELLIRRDTLSFVYIQSHMKHFLTVQGAQDMLDYVMLLTHQSMLYLTNAQKVSVQKTLLTTLLNQESPSIQSLTALYDLLLRTKQKILANVSPQLAFEQLVVQRLLSH